MEINKETVTFAEYCTIYGNRYFMRSYYRDLFTQMEHCKEEQVEGVLEEIVNNIDSFVKAGYHTIAQNMEDRMYQAYDKRK